MRAHVCPRVLEIVFSFLFLALLFLLSFLFRPCPSAGHVQRALAWHHLPALVRSSNVTIRMPFGQNTRKRRRRRRRRRPYGQLFCRRRGKGLLLLLSHEVADNTARSREFSTKLSLLVLPPSLLLLFFFSSSSSFDQLSPYTDTDNHMLLFAEDRTEQNRTRPRPCLPAV